MPNFSSGDERMNKITWQYTPDRCIYIYIYTVQCTYIYFIYMQPGWKHWPRPCCVIYRKFLSCGFEIVKKSQWLEKILIAADIRSTGRIRLPALTVCVCVYTHTHTHIHTQHTYTHTHTHNTQHTYTHTHTTHTHTSTHSDRTQAGSTPSPRNVNTHSGL